MVGCGKTTEIQTTTDTQNTNNPSQPKDEVNMGTTQTLTPTIEGYYGLPRYHREVTNLEVLFSSHVIANRLKATDEFRVIFIGDSSTWGAHLAEEDILAGILDRAGLQTCDGKYVRVYNLAFPGTSLVKDLIFIDKAMEYQPDLVIWVLGLATFRPESQVRKSHILINGNRAYVEDLSKRYDLNLDTTSLSEEEQDKETAKELLKLTDYPVNTPPYPTPTNDLEENNKLTATIRQPPLKKESLPFNLFFKGLEIASGPKVLVVNEPIFTASGQNSDDRYNEYYPKWAYDQYRVIMDEESQTNGWAYLDLWDALPTQEFMDTPLHRTPEGERHIAEILTPVILEMACLKD